jgi:phage portal protein BeeE
VRDALTPWCRRLEQEADFKLMRQDRGPWKCTEIDTRPLLAGDAKSRADAYAIMRQNGIMSANEIRALEGMNDCGDDGDILLVQSNLTTVDR